MNIAEKKVFSTSSLIYKGSIVLVGWSIKETTGANPAELDIYDGTSATSVTGIPPFPVTLLANESSREEQINVRMNNGIWANISSGALEGSIWYIVEE